MEILKSSRLDSLRYDIRGPVYEKALQLQREGYKITSLNIGNPAAFGFETPDEIIHDIIMNIRNAQGYADSRGLFAARKAVMQYYQSRGVKGINIEDVFIGNGVSELITLTMMALLNPSDEILIPSPDYPLWTTSVGLAGGTPVHYVNHQENKRDCFD
jgi:alanine-synthesizing transaminase